jgi:hypothetical protein
LSTYFRGAKVRHACQNELLSYAMKHVIMKFDQVEEKYFLLSISEEVFLGFFAIPRMFLFLKIQGTAPRK